MSGLRRTALVIVLAAGCRSDAEPVQSRCPPPPHLRLPSTVALERVMPQVDIDRAIALVHRPGDDTRWYVATQDGVIHTFTPDARPGVFADLSGLVEIHAETGLLDIAFHPEFADNGAVFVSYDAPGGTTVTSRISRFTSPDGGLTLDLASERIVLELDQPYTNHNGGEIEFGPDGYLYIGFGDGGSAGDPRGNGQNTDVLLGKILRIDPLTTGEGMPPYAIPPDNPFATGGGAPEIFAWGLRNPWRGSFDRQTGALWVGDVGQNRWEEVDRIVLGGNYGWGRKEGRDCIGTDACPGDYVDPVAQYRNTGGASVIAGFVYRGSELPELRGTFVYNDLYDGTIFGVASEGGEPRVLGGEAEGIVSWAEDTRGELYGIDYYGGIFRLVAGDPVGTEDFPRALSQTGCVDMADPTRAPQGLLAYEVNVPLWSDGTDKSRFISPVPGRTASIGDDGDLELPVGTVLVKSFFHDGAPLETRLLVRERERWIGYGYAWDADGSDATLVEDETSIDRDGFRWTLPGLRGCRACHTAIAGGSLGLELGQLAREVTIDGERRDQVAWLGEHGIVPDGRTADPLPGLDADASAESRVRAYLHANCSQCHREDGPGGRAALDLRHATPLADTGLCDAPRAGELDLVDPRIVVPGDPTRSVLSARLQAPGSARMPPLATSIVDAEAAALVDRWISELTDCP